MVGGAGRAGVHASLPVGVRATACVNLIVEYAQTAHLVPGSRGLGHTREGGAPPPGADTPVEAPWALTQFEMHDVIFRGRQLASPWHSAHVNIRIFWRPTESRGWAWRWLMTHRGAPHAWERGGTDTEINSPNSFRGPATIPQRKKRLLWDSAGVTDVEGRGRTATAHGFLPQPGSCLLTQLLSQPRNRLLS